MNKAKRLAQKLKLNRETLRNLSEAEMEDVAGGKLRVTMQDATGCPCKEMAAEMPKEPGDRERFPHDFRVAM